MKGPEINLSKWSHAYSIALERADFLSPSGQDDLKSIRDKYNSENHTIPLNEYEDELFKNYNSKQLFPR